MTRSKPMAPIRAPLAPCKFCGRSVEQDEQAALGHLAEVCPKVPADVRAWAQQHPSLRIGGLTLAERKAKAEKERANDAASRLRARIKGARKNRVWLGERRRAEDHMPMPGRKSGG